MPFDHRRGNRRMNFDIGPVCLRPRAAFLLPTHVGRSAEVRSISEADASAAQGSGCPTDLSVLSRCNRRYQSVEVSLGATKAQNERILKCAFRSA